MENKIKEQVEYYFSDKNLSTDAFFHNKISADKEGWVDLQFVMNCNKIKVLTTDTEEVIKALADSTEVEVDKGKHLLLNANVKHYIIGGIRRKDNKPLVKLNLKAKKEVSKEQDDEESKDVTVLTDRDFKDPKIIEYATSSESEEKPSWRDLEKEIQSKFPSLKLLYSRMDEKVGQLAFSSDKIDNEALESLLKSTVTSAGFEYTFKYPSEDDLKKFWEQHGSHYEMCSSQKLRRSRKRKKNEAGGDKSHKRQKTAEVERQYTIASVTYANISKVKSKAKAIMNVKEDGQKLEGYEEEFVKEILKNHPKHDEKMRDFANFVVDEHPSYPNTR